MKLYLKTPTIVLTPSQRMRVVMETIYWCNENMGTKSKFKTLKVKLLAPTNTKTIAWYNLDKNTIVINHNNNPTIRCLVKSTIHEYSHFLQNLRYYNKILKQVGYDKHPLEIEAKGSEKLYSNCWKEIKNKI
jgi:hypothetical protein